MNGLVKQPIEYVVGTLRLLGLTHGGLPHAATSSTCCQLGQTLFAPPNVGGWGQNHYWLSTVASNNQLGFAWHHAPLRRRLCLHRGPQRQPGRAGGHGPPPARARPVLERRPTARCSSAPGRQTRRSSSPSPSSRPTSSSTDGNDRCRDPSTAGTSSPARPASAPPGRSPSSADRRPHPLGLGPRRHRRALRRLATATTTAASSPRTAVRSRSCCAPSTAATTGSTPCPLRRRRLPRKAAATRHHRERRAAHRRRRRPGARLPPVAHQPAAALPGRQVAVVMRRRLQQPQLSHFVVDGHLADGRPPGGSGLRAGSVAGSTRPGRDPLRALSDRRHRAAGASGHSQQAGTLERFDAPAGPSCPAATPPSSPPTPRCQQPVRTDTALGAADRLGRDEPADRSRQRGGGARSTEPAAHASPGRTPATSATSSTSSPSSSSAGLPTRAYGVALASFDTHAGELDIQRRPARPARRGRRQRSWRLPDRRRARTPSSLIYSEFGRHLQANATAGTDHGSAKSCWSSARP